MRGERGGETEIEEHDTCSHASTADQRHAHPFPPRPVPPPSLLLCMAVQPLHAAALACLCCAPLTMPRHARYTPKGKLKRL